MRLLNISDKLINLKNKLKLKNAVSIAAAVMLGVTSLAGCGFVSNPVEYMSQADNENGTGSDNTDKITNNSGNNAGGMKDNSSDAGSIVNGSDNSNGNNQTSGKRKACIVGTYGSVSELVNTADYETDYTLGKLLVNPEASQHVDRIPLSTVQGKEDFTKANELIDAFSKKFASLNPDSYAKADFNSFYNDYIGEFATVGKVLSRYVNNQTSMVDGYDNQRLQTSGVSSDEELEKMIKYQHAYNAASRYINVVSEMIEHLVTSLGS